MNGELKIPPERQAERFANALRSAARKHVAMELREMMLDPVGDATIPEQSSVLCVLERAPGVHSAEEYCTWSPSPYACAEKMGQLI